jgi:glycosylphosphatidylinositol transamidase (GPIT) subunit GPI8/ABC-type branched-subunit amino acid transport system substrate-binding protein
MRRILTLLRSPIRVRAIRACVALLAPLTLALAQTGCGPDGPLRVAVLMPPTDETGSTQPALEWVAASVNEAGGIDGRTFVIDYEPYDPVAGDESLIAAAERLAADQEHVAVIGPGTSEQLSLVADTFLEHKKPLVSFTSAGAELLRAYGGKGFIWRTRESDIAQTELLVRFARERGASRVALVSTLDPDGYSFFSWFGFFARELGFADDAVAIEALTDMSPCEETVKAALETMPNILFVAVSDPMQVDCVIKAATPMGGMGPKPLIVLADTGLNHVKQLQDLGPIAEGIEGMSPVPFATDFDEALMQRTGGELLPHGASQYDAALLIAYGLQIAEGEGGAALVDGMKAAVTGRDGSFGWDAAGIKGALEAMSDGARPDISGATGPLDFDPDLYMDLAASTFSHWTWENNTRVFHEQYWTGDADFLTSDGVLVHPNEDALPDFEASGSDFSPAAGKAELWAVIAALSSGWENYRHQADALRQYKILRQNGVPDDHILLIVADDIAKASQNPLPGQVRNQTDGENLNTSVEVDYRLNLTAEQLMDIILGKTSAQTPLVVQSSESSNLYIYLSGHGGETGIPVNAATTSQGLSGVGDSLLTPALLRDTLCALRGENRVRRVLVAVESCYSGVFGDAGYFGIESGCDAGATPLSGVTMLTAANVTEVSFASSYDPTVGSWVSDAFSQRFAGNVEGSLSASLADLYKDVYLGVTGSHASLYNLSASGKISGIKMDEFFAP